MAKNNTELNSELRKEAVRLGLCKQWQQEWESDWGDDTLLERYKKGIDFCISNGYPANNFIKENFPLAILRQHGILVDDKWSLINPRVAVIQGESSSTVRYNGWVLGSVYVRHQSKVKVVAKNASFVIVHLFDKAQTCCEAKDKAKIVVLLHSDDAITEDCLGDVVVRDEIGYLAPEP